MQENCDPLKKHERKIKTTIGILTGNAHKKSTKTGQRKDDGIIRNRKEKATQEKTYNLRK